MRTRILLPGIADSTTGNPIPGQSGVQRYFWDILAPHTSRIKNDWRPSSGAEFSHEDFSCHSMKRVEADRCGFVECDFSRVAATGSIWRRCRFDACNLSEGSFQNSIFDRTKFDGIKVEGASFSGASFKNAEFSNVDIKGASFSYCDFTDAVFHAVTFMWTTFEGARFQGASLANFDLSETNIEFSDLRNAHINGVRVSLQQFPFIFGASPDLIQSGRLVVSTEAAGYDNGALPWEALLELVPALINYFAGNNNWFPVANLVLLSGEPEKARPIIGHGIRECILGARYMELKHLCKLAGISGAFDAAELRAMYHSIVAIQNSANPNDYAFLLHEGEIRQYLTPVELDGRVVISFTVNGGEGLIPAEALGKVVSILDDCLVRFGLRLSWDCLASHVNSPNNVVIVIGDNNLISIAPPPPPRGEKSLYSKVTLALAAFGTLFGGLTWYQDLSEQQTKEIEALRNRVCKSIEVSDVTIVYNNQTYLYTLPTGEVVATALLREAVQQVIAQ